MRTAHVVALIATWLLALPTQADQPPPFDPQEYAGKVVVLDFWASWCVPCRRSFPWLNSMHGKYQDAGLVIVGVNLDMERSEAERFLAEFPADFRIVYDVDMALARRFEVMAMPSIPRPGGHISRFLRDEQGSLSIETVIVIPLLLFMTTGGLTYWNAFNSTTAPR